MTKRVITGAAFAVLVVGCVLLHGWAMFTLLSLFLIISTHEMLGAMQAADYRPLQWPAYLFCALTIAAHAFGHAELNNAVLAVSAMGAMVHLVLRGKVDMPSLVASVFPMVYPGMFYMVLMGLLRLCNPAVIIVALVLGFFSASINDVFALFSGMLFGKHKLSPELSPKKTIEGSIGGLIFCVLFSMAVPAIVRLIFGGIEIYAEGLAMLPPVWAFALLGLFAGALSQIGDLTASMVKRHCGVKDFGKLLPGHGGIMDRMDGVLFCGVVCYVFFQLFGLG